jgi:hypothetical protein
VSHPFADSPRSELGPSIDGDESAGEAALLDEGQRRPPVSASMVAVGRAAVPGSAVGRAVVGRAVALPPIDSHPAIDHPPIDHPMAGLSVVGLATVVPAVRTQVTTNRPAEQQEAPLPAAPMRDELAQGEEPGREESPAQEAAAPSRTNKTLLPPVTTLLVAVAELAVVGVVLARLAVAAVSRPVGAAEAYAVARVVAAGQADVGLVPGPWPRQVFEVLFSGGLSAWNVLNRDFTAVAVLRVGQLALAAAVVALVWLLARRLQFSPVGRMLAVLAVGAAPSAVGLLAGAIRPGVLAAGLGAVALVLATGGKLTGNGRASRTRRVMVLVTAVSMLALVPAGLAAVLAAGAVGLAQSELLRGIGTRRRTVLVATLGCLAAVALLVLAVWPPGRLAPVPAATPAIPTPATWEWVLAACAIGLTVVGLFRRWLRAPAVAGLVLLVTAIAAPVAGRGDLLVVALPLIAVVAVGGAEELADTQSLRLTWPGRRVGLRVVAALGVLFVAATGVAVAVADAAGTAPTALRRAAVSAATAWFAGEVPGQPALLVDDVLWPQLLRAGLPAERMRTTTGFGAARAQAGSDATGAQAGLGANGARAGLGANGAQAGVLSWRMVAGDRYAPEGWQRYAVFGAGSGQVTVFGRAEVGQRASLAGARERRAELGASLAGNPRLHLSKGAAAALRSGAVDPRLVFVLADFSGQHELQVTGFPTVAGETPGDPPLHRVMITAVDGRPASQPEATALLRNWLANQLDPYRPRGVDVTDPGLLVRYALADMDV